jgi:hypothetical protein
MRWVLFDGSLFWLSAGVFSSDPREATVIPEADAVMWILGGVERGYDVGGFYPLRISLDGGQA